MNVLSPACVSTNVNSSLGILSTNPVCLLILKKPERDWTFIVSVFLVVISVLELLYMTLWNK
jgi:hypothetical protein